MQTAKNYARAVWGWWWVMMTGWVPGILYFAGIFKGIPIDIPTWGWVIIIFSGVIVAQSLAYRELKNIFTKQVIEPNQVEDILANIADLRLAGEQMRMAGLKLTNANEVPTWINQITGWRKCVKHEIEKLSRSEAKNFYAGYMVDTKDFTKIALCDDHKIFLGAITIDIEKIKDLLERYSFQNLAKRVGIEK